VLTKAQLETVAEENPSLDVSDALLDWESQRLKSKDGES
jgi:hypothetical protein